MPNFTARIGYPLRRKTAFMDQVTVSKPVTPPGIARGHLTPDYNITLRATQERVDTKTPT